MLWVLAVFAALAVSYSFAAKLKYAPDEPAHFIYIRSLAISHAPPPIAHHDTPTEQSESTHEGHQPPLYYAIMAVPFALLRSAGASGNAIWRVLRLLNLSIGLIWIVSVYALAREFFGRPSYAVAAAAFVALIPTSSYMAGVINNEMLITLLFTCAMLPILRYFKTGSITPKSAAALGLIMGLAILTKAQGLLLVPMLLITAFAVWRRRHYASSAETFRSIAIAIGAATAICGWWFVRCWMLYGTPFPQSLNIPGLPRGLIDLVSTPYLCARLAFYSTCAVFGYFWAPFWVIWPFVSKMGPLVYVMGALTVLVLVGVVFRIRRGGVDARSLGLLLIAPLLVYVAWLRYTLFTDKWANLQGRLFLSVAAVVGIVWILGFDGLLVSDRSKRIGLAAGLALMLLANLTIIACAIRLYG